MNKTVAWLDEHNKVVVLEPYRGGGFVREDGAIPESWKPLSTTDFRALAAELAEALEDPGTHTGRHWPADHVYHDPKCKGCAALTKYHAAKGE